MTTATQIKAPAQQDVSVAEKTGLFGEKFKSQSSGQKTGLQSSFAPLADNGSALNNINILSAPLGMIQKKNLVMGEPGDKYERQANKMSSQVMNSVDSEHSAQNIMEQTFGTDLSDIRLHTDSHADEVSRSLNARAFTEGHDVFFKRGEYNPQTSSGQRLMAHEFTHVLQQDNGNSAGVHAAPNGLIQRQLTLQGQEEGCSFEFASVEAIIKAVDEYLKTDTNLPDNITSNEIEIIKEKIKSVLEKLKEETTIQIDKISLIDDPKKPEQKPEDNEEIKEILNETVAEQADKSKESEDEKSEKPPQEPEQKPEDPNHNQEDKDNVNENVNEARMETKIKDILNKIVAEQDGKDKKSEGETSEGETSEGKKPEEKSQQANDLQEFKNKWESSADSFKEGLIKELKNPESQFYDRNEKPSKFNDLTEKIELQSLLDLHKKSSENEAPTQSGEESESDMVIWMKKMLSEKQTQQAAAKMQKMKASLCADLIEAGTEDGGDTSEEIMKSVKAVIEEIVNGLEYFEIKGGELNDQDKKPASKKRNWVKTFLKFGINSSGDLANTIKEVIEGSKKEDVKRAVKFV